MYIAICDDHIETARDLQQKILQLPLRNISGIDIFTDSAELMFAAGGSRYDIVFMDIELGNVSGIELSAELLRAHPDIQIIFISGYDDYYLQVYDVKHVFFLRKPIELPRLQAALESAQSRIEAGRSEFLLIENKQCSLRVPQSGIMYMEKNRRLIQIHMADGEIYSTYGKLPELLEALNGFFFQCHTSFIVNFRYIREMAGKKFILSPSYADAAVKSGRPEEIEIPVSRKYYNEAREKFLRYLA